MADHPSLRTGPDPAGYEVNGKKQRHPTIDFRTGVRRAAEEASVAVNDYERALVLGQVAELLAAHPRIGGRIAFKGGAVMTLFDGSPRLSRDLDAVLVSGGRISEAIVRQALSAPEARKVVMRVDRFVTSDKKGIRFPVVVCHPLSGRGEVHLMLSINWSSPLLCEPEPGTFEIGDRTVTLRTMARWERLAEKVRAFLDRGEDRDAFDLAHFVERGLKLDEWETLPGLIEQKMRVDEDLPAGCDLHALFDQHIDEIGPAWGTRGGLTLMRETPSWDEVLPRIRRLKRHVPRHKP
jgi:hypothetical protein